MEISILAVVVVVFIIVTSYIAWQGFRTRCPNCGKTALRFKDKNAHEKQQESYELVKSVGLLDSLNQFGSGSRLANKPGYINTPFQCTNCDTSFERDIAAHWLSISNKIGDRQAVAEYKKLQDELKN